MSRKKKHKVSYADTVNKMYNNLMNATEISDSKDNNEEDKSLDDINLDENNTNEESSSLVMGIQNGNTGVVGTEEADAKRLKEIAENSFKHFANNAEDNISEVIKKSSLGNYLDQDDVTNMESVNAIRSMIKRKIKGEKFSVYNEFPQLIKNKIADIVMDSGQPMNKQSLNFIANYILGEMVAAYENPGENAIIDMETMLSNFDDQLQSMYDKGNTEIGKESLGIIEQTKVDVDKAIQRCIDENNPEGVERMQSIKSGIDEAYNLNKFINALAHIKIKKFDLEKPDRVYDIFVNKYRNHKYNINDIRVCPYILSRHFPNESEENLTRLCLSFCKYIQNMSPDNIEEHTFMYYFIRYIYLLDSLNPRGTLYESLEGKSKEFYDGFIGNLSIALSMIKK